MSSPYNTGSKLFSNPNQLTNNFTTTATTTGPFQPSSDSSLLLQHLESSNNVVSSDDPSQHTHSHRATTFSNEFENLSTFSEIQYDPRQLQHPQNFVQQTQSTVNSSSHGHASPPNIQQVAPRAFAKHMVDVDDYLSRTHYDTLDWDTLAHSRSLVNPTALSTLAHPRQPYNNAQTQPHAFDLQYYLHQPSNIIHNTSETSLYHQQNTQHSHDPYDSDTAYLMQNLLYKKDSNQPLPRRYEDQYQQSSKIKRPSYEQLHNYQADDQDHPDHNDDHDDDGANNQGAQDIEDKPFLSSSEHMAHSLRQIQARNNFNSKVLFFSWIAAITAIAIANFNHTHKYLVEIQYQQIFQDYISLFGGHSQQVEITFFTAPKPFVGDDANNQIRAIESWLQLVPRPKIVLLGDDKTYSVVQHLFPHASIRVDNQVEKNFLGVPLFNSMVLRANSSAKQNSVVVLLNSDILVFDDFSIMLQKACIDYEHFLLVAARWDIDDLPPNFNQRTNKYQWRRYLTQYFREQGSLHAEGGVDMWVWNVPGPPLYKEIMPSFVYGRGRYDNWFTHEAITSSSRTVVDVSDACTIGHISHDYHLVVGGQDAEASRNLRRGFWNDQVTEKFELYINSYLSLTHGSYRFTDGTVLHARFKMVTCYESLGLCNLYRRRPNICRCENSPFVSISAADSYIVDGSRIIFCGFSKSQRKAPEMTLTGAIHNPAIQWLIDEKLNLDDATMNFQGNHDKKIREKRTPFGLPLILPDLVKLYSDLPFVTVTAANSNQVNIVLALSCNMKFVKSEGFVIAALDDAMYSAAVGHGLAAYLETSIYNSEQEMNMAEGLTKQHDYRFFNSLRVRVILQVLKRGRNILWMDPDVVWVSSPTKVFANFEQNDFGILTNSLGGLNEPGFLSLGLVYVRSTPFTIKALESIVQRYEKDNTLSIESMLYDQVCGEARQWRRGDEMCQRTEAELKLSTRFLENKEYFVPLKIHSGEISNLLRPDSVTIFLHINHLLSRDEKLEFLKKHGLNFYDESTSLCRNL